MATRELNDSLLDFSIDLYKQLASTNNSSENIVFSPFSISAALYMALAGARNVTAKQLADVLHVNGDEVHQNFFSFRSKLTGLAPGVKLRVANRMCTDETLPVLDSYGALIRDSYGATLETVDFKNDFENVRRRINAWVEQVTETKIRDLLPRGSVNSLTKMILVNAVYFKGLWECQFEPALTERSDFHLDKRNTTKVDMMYKEDDYKMGHDNDLAVTALEIPYKSGKASMVILLPDDIEGLAQLEERLTFAKMSHLLKCLTLDIDVQLGIPKFTLEQTVNLKQTLYAMGIEDFFTEAADLKGIFEKYNVPVSEVFHKTFVEVNEEGTEAASATALDMCDCAALDQTLFIVNRPFMFFILSYDPKAVLFMGSVRRI